MNQTQTSINLISTLYFLVFSTLNSINLNFPRIQITTMKISIIAVDCFAWVRWSVGEKIFVSGAVLWVGMRKICWVVGLDLWSGWAGRVYSLECLAGCVMGWRCLKEDIGWSFEVLGWKLAIKGRIAFVGSWDFRTDFVPICPIKFLFL